MTKKQYVRVVYNDGQATTREFNNKLAATSYAMSERELVEDKGLGKVYLYEEGQTPEDCAQSFIGYLAQNLFGGVT